MNHIIKLCLALILGVIVFVHPTSAQAQTHDPLGGTTFSMMSRARATPLGGRGLLSTRKSQYKFAATKRILDATKQQRRKARVSGGKSVLVLYDSSGSFGWIGELYSLMMVNELSHFNVNINRLPVEKYTQGLMDTCDATFYLGILYDNPLPTAFTQDALSTTKPLCWAGYNLWKIAWNADYSWNTNFISKYGMTFYYMDFLGYPTVQYKGVNLTKLQYEPIQGRVEITDSNVAQRLAVSTRPDGISIGYITKGANLYYVADNPFAYTTFTSHDDRILAFEDSIHEVLGTNAAVDHRADIRLEDVSPIVPAATLKALADAMAAENVPFVVSVIPRFEDPNGVETGKAQTRLMSAYPTFIAALKYMESKGGKIIMHGYTHQYSNLPNPYNGESADDFEFFRVTQNANLSTTYIGPVNEDSSTWASDRLTAGLDLFKASGFTNVDTWVTPHYMASPTDYVEIQKQFKLSICRSLTFNQDSYGNLVYVTQHCPWVYTDLFGIKRVPETIGYVDAEVFEGIPPNLPADLVRYAKAVSVVRDGWAGLYFHWYNSPAQLTQLLQGVKGLGYRFVMPDASLN